MNRSSSASTRRRSTRQSRQSSGSPRSKSDRSARRTSKGGGASSDWSRHGTALPSWADLEPSKNRRRPDATEDSFLQRVSTVRFALIVLLVAGAFTLYVGHVHATKDLLGKVQKVRAENQRLHLKRNRLQSQFDRRTSPSVIYERARELGLRESVTYGPPINVE